MKKIKIEKVERTLEIYTKLMNGYLVNKAEEAQRYEVDKRTIQRDIDSIRNFLVDMGDGGCTNAIVYDRKGGGYRMEHLDRHKFSNSEILALCKILLDSRAFIKEEMKDMVCRLISCCVPQSCQKDVDELIRSELHYYTELQHKTRFMDTLWEIGQAIRKSQYIDIKYKRTKDGEAVNRRLRPAAVMFSEFYFYLAAFIDDEDVRKDFEVINDPFPTIYRIDRIKELKVPGETFRIEYKDKFKEGEFRKRIQFMYGGRLQKITFKYFGGNIEAVLDRLPTAKVLSKEEGVYVVAVEVFGRGIDMWIRSQGDNIEIIKRTEGVNGI